jgi:hypothetical protein
LCWIFNVERGAAIVARVQVINETTLNNSQPIDWTLWFQWCRYLYDDGTMEYGYRFIWKRPQAEGGSLQAARGQARIPSVTMLEQLVAQARAGGWGGYNADDPPPECQSYGFVAPDGRQCEVRVYVKTGAVSYEVHQGGKMVGERQRKPENESVKQLVERLFGSMGAYGTTAVVE